MAKKPGRPKTRKSNEKITLIKLPEKWRCILNADFGGYQAGVEELVKRYVESKKC